MAVIIKGFNELPRSCEECIFTERFHNEDGTEDIKCVINNKYVSGYIAGYIQHTRSHSCPLTTMKNGECRPCLTRNGRTLFHRWINDGERALVEYENGSVDAICIDDILRFLDTKTLMSDYSCFTKEHICNTCDNKDKDWCKWCGMYDKEEE